MGAGQARGLASLDEGGLGDRQLAARVLDGQHRRWVEMRDRMREKVAELADMVCSGANHAHAGHVDGRPCAHTGEAGRRCRMKAASALSEAKASTPAARLSIFTP